MWGAWIPWNISGDGAVPDVPGRIIGDTLAAGVARGSILQAHDLAGSTLAYTSVEGDVIEAGSVAGSDLLAGEIEGGTSA